MVDIKSLLTIIEIEQQWSFARRYQRDNDGYRVEFRESVYVMSWSRARELRELTGGNIYHHNISGEEKLAV